MVTYNQRAGAGARRGASVQRSGTGAARRVCAATGAARLYSGRRGASVQRPATAVRRTRLVEIKHALLNGVISNDYEWIS